MGKKANILWEMIIDNWHRNGRRILSAFGLFLIAVLLASIIPVSTLFSGGGVWSTFGAKAYEYFIVLIVFIIGVVFGKPNGDNKPIEKSKPVVDGTQK
jgi:hypothetical protein